MITKAHGNKKELKYCVDIVTHSTQRGWGCVLESIYTGPSIHEGPEDHLSYIGGTYQDEVLA